MGFVQRFLVFARWVGIRDNSRPRLNVGDIVLDDHRPQCDAGVHVIGIVNVANRSGIWTPAMWLELVNDLHRPNLGCSGDGSRGKARH